MTFLNAAGAIPRSRIDGERAKADLHVKAAEMKAWLGSVQSLLYKKFEAVTKDVIEKTHAIGKDVTAELKRNWKHVQDFGAKNLAGSKAASSSGKFARLGERNEAANEGRDVSKQGNGRSGRSGGRPHEGTDSRQQDGSEDAANRESGSQQVRNDVEQDRTDGGGELLRERKLDAKVDHGGDKPQGRDLAGGAADTRTDSETAPQRKSSNQDGDDGDEEKRLKNPAKVPQSPVDGVAGDDNALSRHATRGEQEEEETEQPLNEGEALAKTQTKASEDGTSGLDSREGGDAISNREIEPDTGADAGDAQRSENGTGNEEEDEEERGTENENEEEEDLLEIKEMVKDIGEIIDVLAKAPNLNEGEEDSKEEEKGNVDEKEENVVLKRSEEAPKPEEKFRGSDADGGIANEAPNSESKDGSELADSENLRSDKEESGDRLGEKVGDNKAGGDDELTDNNSAQEGTESDEGQEANITNITLKNDEL